MNISSQYAKALYQSQAPDVRLIKNFFELLKRRGHQKLAPSILNEYKKLVLQKERTLMHAHTTPQQEETRVLLQLYRRLVATE